MDTQFVTTDPPDPATPGSRDHHVVIVGEAGSNTDLMAETLGECCSVEVAETQADVDCLLAAPTLVSVAVVDVTSATTGVRELVTRLRENDVPVLLLSTSVSPPLRRYASDRAAFEVREKPIRRAELRENVASLARD